MNRKTGLLIGIVFALVFFGIMTYNMMDLRRHRVEVCITYHGRTECRQAAGSTRAEAVRTATDAACSMLAGGMTDTMQCGRTAPTSVNDLK